MDVHERPWAMPRLLLRFTRLLQRPVEPALAYVVNGVCVVRYDNEIGKGDHRHIGGVETPYRFRSPDAMQADFWLDVAQWEIGK